MAVSDWASRQIELIELLQSVTSAANEAQSVRMAVQSCLERICAFTGWEIGHVSVLPSATEAGYGLEDVWHFRSTSPSEELIRVSAQMGPLHPDSLPARVILERKPVWYEDAKNRPQNIRTATLDGLKINGGFAFPVCVDQEIIGVMEFFTRQITPRAEGLSAIVSQIGIQIGHVFERSRANRLLEESYAKAQEAVTLREDFLAIVSHDLKNPLTSVRLNLELMDRSLDHGQDRIFLKKATNRMGQTIVQMSRLIDDLLDVSRISSGSLLMDRNPWGVQQLLEQAAEVLKPIGLERSIYLDVRCTGELVAFCDRDRIMQVVSNLVGNAIKFSPPGSSVSLEADQVDQKIVVSVIDRGAGIPLEHLERIFDRYWQAPATKRQGTGLGLYIAKGIVEAHGGKIWAESGAQGSKFSFSLPTSA